MLSELTICSVNYKHSKHLIANIELVKLLNSRIKIKWVIFNNEPDKNAFVDIIQNYSYLVEIVNGSQINFAEHGKGSKNHATGLDSIITKAKTRFVLILDPDFYIILPNWAERIMKYMNHGNIALFGVPWHPKWEIKYRYFPCVHCLLMDTEYIDLSSLSFMPEFENIDPLSTWRRLISKIPLVGGRASIGRSNDIIAQGHPAAYSFTTAFAFCTMIVMDLLLIPRFSINGAAMGSSISYIAATIFVIYIYIKITKNSLKSLFIPLKSDFIFYKNFIINLISLRPIVNRYTNK